MIDELLNEIENIKREFVEEVKRIQSHVDLKEKRDKYLSRKKGIIVSLLKRLKDLSSESKPIAGKHINQLKIFVENTFAELTEKVNSSKRVSDYDYTLPEIDFENGGFHLISHIKQKIENIFISMGYHIAYGPEIETEYNNFEALNIPDYHPARDEQDTFFIKDEENLILRTHTSPVQIRYMKSHKPPIKIISPGKVFRKDEPDATHSPVFHQIEGLVVDKGINFSHLKGTLELFIKSFFGRDVRLRFRPSYFPFTEPSAEVDMSCFLCNGEDENCKVCKGTGWLEILGSGMVHPVVLQNCGIDTDEYSGFAFGMGIERIAMIKYGVTDLRLLYDNDLRLLKQFG